MPPSSGLDRQAFDACLDSGATRSVWQKDRADAEAYGVNGTPALFVNGRPVFGIVPLSELAGVIDEELARASRANPGRQ